MQGLLLKTSKQLLRLQPPPKVPSNPKEYIGYYTATVDGVKVKKQPIVLFCMGSMKIKAIGNTLQL